MPTLQDLFDRVKRRAGRLAERKEDPTIALNDADDSILQDYARQVAVEIAQETSRIQARATIGVSQDQAEYELAASVGRVMKVVWSPEGSTDGTELKVLPGHEARAEAEQAIAAGTNGAVEAVGFHGGSMWISVPPTQAGTIRLYYIAESLLGEENSSFTSDEEPAGDLSEHLPPELEETFVNGLLFRHFEDVGLYNVAERLEQKYWNKLDDVDRRPRKQRTTTRPSRWLT